MNIKDLFDKAENGVLNYETFAQLAKESGANFTDLAEGKYVSKNKYDDEIKSKDDTINRLNTTIKTRDTDLSDLKAKLEAAGTDNEKLTTLSNDFASLQTKYEADVKSYKAQLKKQAQEFAVKDYANTKNFTSQAAKRDFTSYLLSQELKLDSGVIIGADDMANIYAQQNPDAFVKEPVVEEKPKFAAGTQGDNSTKLSLSEMMKAKNDNPALDITF